MVAGMQPFPGDCLELLIIPICENLRDTVHSIRASIRQASSARLWLCMNTIEPTRFATLHTVSFPISRCSVYWIWSSASWYDPWSCVQDTVSCINGSGVLPGTLSMHMAMSNGAMVPGYPSVSSRCFSACDTPMTILRAKETGQMSIK